MAGSGFDKSRYSRYTRAGRRRHQRYSQVSNLKTALTNTTPPVIAVQGGGLATVASVLVVTSTGVWTETPTSFTYQWQRAGVDIAGATVDSYTLPADPAPNSQAFQCVATALKGAKTGTSNSNVITAEA